MISKLIDHTQENAEEYETIDYIIECNKVSQNNTKTGTTGWEASPQGIKQDGEISLQ